MCKGKGSFSCAFWALLRLVTPPWMCQWPQKVAKAAQNIEMALEFFPLCSMIKGGNGSWRDAKLIRER